MNNRPLKTILADLADNVETSKRDLESIPTSVRSGHAGAVRRAQEAIPMLKKEYQDALLASSLALFVEGGAEGAPDFFAEIAYDEAVLPADAGALYSSLAELIGPLMSSSKEFGIDQTVRLDYLLRGVATNSGYGRAVDLPRSAATHTIPTKQALTQHIRKLAETTVDGPKLNVLVTLQKLTEAAVSHRVARKTFIVSVLNASPADRKLLEAVFTKSVTVDLTGVEKINPSFVIETLKQARNETPPKVETPPPAAPAPDANE